MSRIRSPSKSMDIHRSVVLDSSLHAPVQIFMFVRRVHRSVWEGSLGKMSNISFFFFLKKALQAK